MGGDFGSVWCWRGYKVEVVSMFVIEIKVFGKGLSDDEFEVLFDKVMDSIGIVV